MNLIRHVADKLGDTLRRHVLVGVSGGVDSMVLLHVLAGLVPAGRGKLTVAHFNHQLRGRHSEADQRLVKQTAKLLGLPVVLGRGNVAREAGLGGVSIEMAARAMRHEFLARSAPKTGAKFIILAHHADDQVELFFLRLFRGAGGDGLGGMSETSPSPADSRLTLLRPLLDVPKSALESFARERGITFREDASNQSVDFLRNRIRVELLPLIRRNYQAAIESTVLRTAKILSEDSRCVESLAAQWLTHRSVSFSSLAVAVQRRALVIQLLRMKLPSSFETVEHLRLHPGDPLTLTPDVTVFRETGGKLKLGRKVSLAFKPRSKLIRFTHKTGNGTMAGMAFQWRLARTKTDGKIQPQAGREIFDTEKIGTHIRLRHWQPGDRFQPIGLKSAAKLQDLLVNKKIPAQQRRRLIVAETSTGQIFWVEGLRIGEIAKVTPQTHLHLTWRWSR